MKRTSLMLAALGLAFAASAIEKPQTAKEIEGLYYMEGIVSEQGLPWKQGNIGVVNITSDKDGKLSLNNLYFRGLNFEINFDAAAQTITIPMGQTSVPDNATPLTVYNLDLNTRKASDAVLQIDAEHRVISFNGVSSTGKINNTITLAMPDMSPGANTVVNIAQTYIWFTNSQMQTRTQEQYAQQTSTAYPIWVEMKDGKLIVDNFAGNGFWDHPISFVLDNNNHFAYAREQVVTVKDNLKFYLWGSTNGYLDETPDVGFVGEPVESEDGWWSLTAGGTIGILNEKYTTTNPPTTSTYDKFFVEAIIFVPFNPFQTGIENIEADSNAPVEYFNLQGIRVSNPSNGVFIRRQGKTASKVLIK